MNNEHSHYFVDSLFRRNAFTISRLTVELPPRDWSHRRRTANDSFSIVGRHEGGQVSSVAPSPDGHSFHVQELELLQHLVQHVQTVVHLHGAESSVDGMLEGVPGEARPSHVHVRNYKVQAGGQVVIPIGAGPPRGYILWMRIASKRKLSLKLFNTKFLKEKKDLKKGKPFFMAKDSSQSAIFA